MRLLTITLYFILATVFLSSIGVSLPYILDQINENPDINKNLVQNLTTYGIAILVLASLDIVLKLIDKNVSYKKPAILGIITVDIIMLSLMSFVLYKSNANQTPHLSIPITGLILAYIMWWIANYNNSNFNIKFSNAPLGGDSNKDLTNG